MDTRTSFTSIFILWISVCVCLVSGESVIPVSGEEGSTVVLPCKLETVDTDTPHIKWTRKSEIVFERKGNQFYQGERYVGRVDVPEEELRKGDCSLVLSNLTLNDNDVYTSRQVLPRSKRSIYTELKELSRVSLSVSDQVTEEKSGDVSSPTGDAERKCPHTLILVLSLISSLFFDLFLLGNM